MERPNIPEEQLARCVKDVEAQGFAILEGAVSHAFCDEIIDEVQRLESIGPQALPRNEFTGYETLRYFDLLNQAEIWERVATLPAILEVVRGVLGGDMLLSAGARSRSACLARRRRGAARALLGGAAHLRQTALTGDADASCVRSWNRRVRWVRGSADLAHVSQRKKLGELLIEAGLLDESHLRTALSDQGQWGRMLGITLIKLGFLDEGDLLRVLSQQLDHLFSDIDGKEIAPEVLELVPYDMSLEKRCVPLLVKPCEPRDELYLGMCDPSSLELVDDVTFRTSMKVVPVLVAEGHLDEAIDVNYRRRASRELTPITLDDIRAPEATSRAARTVPTALTQTPAPKPTGEPEIVLSQETAQTSSSVQPLDRSLLDALIQILIQQGMVDAGELMRRAKALAKAQNQG